ncbi:MAG: T9SS type A sorting domain-containing protein [candidate division FCPU426 bacterium]
MLLFCLLVTLGCLANARAEQLGNTSSNNSEAFSSAIRGSVFQATTGFLATSISVDLDCEWYLDPDVAVAVYTAYTASNWPETLLSSTGYANAHDGWNTYTLNPAVPILPGQKYFLCVDIHDPIQMTEIRASTSIPGTRWYKEADAPFPNPFSPDGLGPNNTLAIYISGPAFTPTQTSTPTPTLTTTPTLTVTPTATPTPSVTMTPTVTLTPTLTMTSTITATPTNSPTSSPSVTPSPTLESSPALTGTSTGTPAATPSLTATPATPLPGTPTSTQTCSAAATAVRFDVDVMAYPQPANQGRVYFRFAVEAPSQVRFEIYNMLGECVCRWTEDHPEVGYSRSAWDCRDVAPGVYLYRLVFRTALAERTTPLKKAVVMKTRH